jgi:hypothetical protein
MYDIPNFWTKALKGAVNPTASKLDGWHSSVEAPAGFVEPMLSPLGGDASSAKLFIISAPGAVGKSTLASALAHEVGFALIDLAVTTPLGGNFFKGGLANAFGFDALPRAARGEIGLIVDGLDEAQLRAAPEAFEAALLDLADIVAGADALPAVLLGRAIAAEDTALILELAGHAVCTLKINFFDENRAVAYLHSKSERLASRVPELREAYEKHAGVFHALAEETRRRLTSVSGGADERFAGYAPVLDAISEYALDPEQTNPSRRLAVLEGETQVELVESVANAILGREQRKLLDHLRSKCSHVPPKDLSALYSATEQRERVLSRILSLPSPSMPSISDPRAREAYSEMVSQLIGQHPFLDASSPAPANLVFAADLMVWGLLESKMADNVRAALTADPRLLSGILFDLYTDQLDAEKSKELPLADAGLLYQALQSQMSARQRALIDVSSGEEETVSVSFEVTDQDNPDAERAHGPYCASSETALELRAPFSHVYIDAPIWVSLGDGSVQQIGAPTEIMARELSISARQVFVHGSSSNDNDRQVVLAADECDAANVQAVSVSRATLTVTWPNALVHPWTTYATEPTPSADPDINFMRRRLRSILTSFRSHSRGNLVRFAPKIDALRMTKDKRGANLITALLDDGILDKFSDGKFYVLDPDRMGSVLGLDYHALQQQRYSASVDEYLSDVLKRNA